MSSQQNTNQVKNDPWPSPEDALKILKLAVSLRKTDPVPIEQYFFLPSVRGEVCLVNDGEVMEIYRNKDEHSSRIQRRWNVGKVCAVLTDNSLHLISADTPVRNVAPGEIEHSEEDDFGDDLNL